MPSGQRFGGPPPPGRFGGGGPPQNPFVALPSNFGQTGQFNLPSIFTFPSGSLNIPTPGAPSAPTLIGAPMPSGAPSPTLGPFGGSKGYAVPNIPGYAPSTPGAPGAPSTPQAPYGPTSVNPYTSPADLWLSQVSQGNAGG